MNQKKTCYFCDNGVVIDYKNVGLMNKFTTQYGKIQARYYTKTCLRHQKKLSKAIKLARIMALIPYMK